MPSISRSIGASISRSITSGIGGGERAVFQSDLKSTLVPQIANGSLVPTYTRAGLASVPDFESVIIRRLQHE